MYEYKATVLKVVDGDTIDANVDLGFSIYKKERLRLNGLNAPEKGSIEGVKSKEWLTTQLPVGTVVTIKTQKDKTEKYGRMLATVFLNDTNVNASLIELGLAAAWDGVGPRPT